jgi:uncharacterized protein
VHFKLDSIIGVVFILVQWRITVLLLGFLRRRWPGLPQGGRVAAAVLVNLILLGAFALSFSQLVSHYRLPPRISLFLGAGALAYVITAAVVLVTQAAVSVVKRWLAPVAMHPGRRRFLDAAGAALVASPCIALGYGALVERTNFQVREIDVPIPGLPDDLVGLRLLHLSDIHLSAFLSERQLARVIDASNELRARVAVVTGDLISSHGDPLDACLRQIARLRSDAGTFGCMGNHERYAGAERYTEVAAARLGIKFLRSESRVLRFGGADVNLAGVDHQAVNQPARYLLGAERMVRPDAVNVLLSHNPDVFPVAARKGFDLTLSGHTHGGQVTMEILEQSLNPARFITPFVHGLYQEGKAAAYVTRGIGTIGIPARIGATPEISLLRLRKA